MEGWSARGFIAWSGDQWHSCPTGEAFYFGPIGVGLAFGLGLAPLKFTLGLKGSQWLWKLAVVIVLYELLYFGFGYFVAWKNPAVTAFYHGTDDVKLSTSRGEASLPDIGSDQDAGRANSRGASYSEITVSSAPRSASLRARARVSS